MDVVYLVKREGGVGGREGKRGEEGEGEWRSQPPLLNRDRAELFKDYFYNFIFAHNFPVLCLKCQDPDSSSHNIPQGKH